MFPHDSVADAQAQTCSLADTLGGEERIEDAVGLGYTVAVVPEANFCKPVGGQSLNLDAAGSSGFNHRVVGVVDYVQEDLLELVAIADNLRKRIVQFLDDR